MGKKVQKLQRVVDKLAPDGHPKLLHLWPPKLPQAGRSDYGGLMLMSGLVFLD